MKHPPGVHVEAVTQVADVPAVEMTPVKHKSKGQGMDKIKGVLHSIPLNTVLTVICAVLAVTNPGAAATVCPLLHATAQAVEAQ